MALTEMDVVPLKHGMVPAVAVDVRTTGCVIVTDEDAWHPNASTTMMP